MYSILCIQIPGVYAALFEKVVACVCVCECELDATGVALSQIDKRSPCGTIRCQASDWSRKCVLTGEMCLSTEKVVACVCVCECELDAAG